LPIAYPESEIEELVSALQGVMASSVVLDDEGGIAEVHVLAEARIHPKQIVRNIESALSAGLGVVVDRRAISVAQVRPEHHEAVSETLAEGAVAWEAEEAPPRPSQEAEPAAGRFIFVGYDARTQPDLEATCRVSIRRGNEVASGTGSGPGTPQGRAQAAATAVFAAIGTAVPGSAVGLEGVAVVESHGRSYVLVAAHADVGRSTVPLTGVAALVKTPEEAGILAALQATNRWNELGNG
jgi:hypothetical protein